MELLRLEDVSIAYEHEKRYAVENVSFSVESGEYVCLIGHNGSGKSTLMKGIVGLVPVTKGKIIRHIEPEEYAYMAQIQMIDKNFPATVQEIVLSGTQRRGLRLPFYTKKDRATAAAAMETFDITGLADKRIGNLSGGQQQRVLLARAFCRHPKLLILDEPCAGLDPAITEEFYKLLSQYNKQSRITILMASHDMEQVEAYASRVIVMNQTVEYDGSSATWNGHYYGDVKEGEVHGRVH